MEALLIKLAREATLERFNPYPPMYEKTKDGFDTLQRDLKKLPVLPDNSLYPLQQFITNTEMDVVCHANTMHSDITEYEFKHAVSRDVALASTHPTRNYLFHGSNLRNWYGIMHKGILNMSNTPLMSAGAAYGEGVYLSDILQVSLSYGTSAGGKYYVAVVELLEDKNLHRKANGYYVVKDHSKLVLRYMWEFSSYIRTNGSDVLQYYETQRALMSRDRTKLKRLTNDMSVIDFESGNVTYISGVPYRVYTWNYPFSPPQIQCVYRVTHEKFDSSSTFKVAQWSAVMSIADILMQIKECNVQPDTTCTVPLM